MRMSSTDISLTRREIAICLLAATASSALPHWAAAQDDHTHLNITLPAAGGANGASFEVFIALSQIVLIETDLDRAVARRLYDLFMAEPYGPKHIATCYAGLRETFSKRGERGGQDTFAHTKLAYGETWFISHLVTTWYVGVYYHPERPTQWIMLQEAMMYRPARGLIPEPYYESVGFGSWANPPGLETPK
jgi:hypothetical protein